MYGNVGVCHGEVEAGLRGGGLGVFVLSSEAFDIAMQAPEVVGVL